MKTRINATEMGNIDPKRGIIVSFPRNGLNWVRYCIEYFSGLPTAGRRKIHPQSSGELAVYRTHNVTFPGPADSCYCSFYDQAGKPLHSKVVLLVRDYHESYVRAARKKQETVPTAEEIREGKIFNFKNYFENLKAYDEFSGRKMLVYYEDLINDFSEMTKILDFLGFAYDLADFDLEHHRHTSLELYDTQHKSYTKDNLYNFTFHQEQVDPEVNRALDEFVDTNYRDVADRYLRRSTPGAQRGRPRHSADGRGRVSGR